MAATSDEILHDFSPFFRAYEDGRVERFVGLDLVPPSVDPDTGVESRDVEFVPEQNLSARIYLPKDANSAHKRPLFVYYHGGGFMVESPFSNTYHKYLNSIVAEANVVAVSVNYRLAPEYYLPTAYEDSWLALKWAASHSKGDGNEPWLRDYVDFDRVYIGGDSAGGNIAHNMAVRVGVEKLDGSTISGMCLNCPYFWGTELIGDEAEMNKNSILNKDILDRVWLYTYPTSTGVDDPLLNPAMDDKISSLSCKRVLVFVAEKDFLRHRGRFYKEALEKSGWVGDVEVVQIEGEDHVFNVGSPTSDKAIAMVKKIASFVNQN